MKIALVSDTHGVCRKELFDHIKNCDYLIHTGDFDNERTYNRFLNCGIPMYAVRGNCDHGEWASYLHEFVSVPIGGKLFYLVHNKSDLPFDLTDADFIIFGHTHVFTHYDRYGKVFINPGSAGADRGDGKGIAILELTDDGYDVERILLQTNVSGKGFWLNFLPETETRSSV